MASNSTRSAKVGNGFAGSALSAQQHRLFTLGRTEGKLVQRQSLTTSLHNAGTSSLGKLEGSNGHLGNNLETLVIGDSANHDRNGGILSASQVLGNTGKGNGGTVSLAHTQTLQDNLVEGRAGTAGQETIQLDEEHQVDVVSSGRGALTLLDVVTININTLKDVSNCRKMKWMDELGQGKGGRILTMSTRLSHTPARIE